MWTAAVYLAGGENVAKEMIPALHALRDASLENQESLSSLAQFEPPGKPPRLFAFDERLVRRLSLSRKSRAFAPQPWGLANYEHPLDAGSSRELLKRFAETARTAARDDSLLLVISGHANGAVGEFLGCRTGSDPLDLSDLGQALEGDKPHARKIDILGMDCCHMSMVEVAYELRPYARFLVASEGEILNHGWPYREILEAVAERSPREAAAAIARRYVDTYCDYSLVGVDADCAVTDLDELPRLTAPMRRLSELLISGIADPDIWRPAVLAHWEAQSYKDEEYVDLADFSDRLRLHIADTSIREVCSEVIEAVSRIVGASCSTGSGFQFSTGLSIYFPWCNDAVKSAGAGGVSELSKYRALAFSRETHWDDFLDAYLSVTRRAPRVGRASDRAEKETQSEREETIMNTKRVTPWSKGSSRRASVKNHPRTGETAEGAISVLRVDPWQSKSRLDPSPRKNHPRQRND
jgi:Clostripain family